MVTHVFKKLLPLLINMTTLVSHHSLSLAYTNRLYVGILILIIQAKAALINIPELLLCSLVHSSLWIRIHGAYYAGWTIGIQPTDCVEYRSGPTTRNMSLL